MSCILRVAGVDFDVDGFLAAFPIPCTKIYRKGEPRFSRQPEGRKNATSGLHIEVSEADFNELELQMRDAQVFLQENRGMLEHLRDLLGIEFGSMDFGVEIRPPGYSSFRFNSELMRAAGEMGISLELSVYPQTQIEKDPRNTGN